MGQENPLPKAYDIIDVNGEEMFMCPTVTKGIVIKNLSLVTANTVSDLFWDYPVLTPEGLICIKFSDEEGFVLATQEEIEDRLEEQKAGYGQKHDDVFDDDENNLGIGLGEEELEDWDGLEKEWP